MTNLITRHPTPDTRHPVALLICAATVPELKCCWREGESHTLSEREPVAQAGRIAYALTGVGIPQTLGRMLPLVRALHPAMILNIGIAGAYPGRGLEIGGLVMAESEIYGDVGFELPDEPGFRSIGESDFGGYYAPGFALSIDASWNRTTASGAPCIGRGCTVNACTGSDRTGLLRARLYEADFESMEGAAVAQVGQQEGVPVCELRAISNIAARRDMRPENIVLALTNLRQHLRACPPASE